MKFLCIACNTQMKLIKNETAATPDNKGTLSMRWECPDCLYEMGMFTNSYETQLVSSMGVEIGGKTVASPTGQTATESAPQSTGKCPFSATARDAMMESMGASPSREQPAPKVAPMGNVYSEADNIKAALSGAPTGSDIQWTAQAMDRLQNIPSFIRPVAKQGIEKLAKDRGVPSVTESFLDEAKQHFNM